MDFIKNRPTRCRTMSSRWMVLCFLLLVLMSSRTDFFLRDTLVDASAAQEAEAGSCLSTDDNDNNGSCTSSNNNGGSEGDAVNLNTSSSDSSRRIMPAGASVVGIEDDKNDEKDGADPCQDQHEKCEFWAHHGECNNNPRYMHPNCVRSCGLCPDQRGNAQQQDDEETELHDLQDDLMKGTDMGVPQELDSTGSFPISREQIDETIQKARHYIETRVKGVMDNDTLELCKNQNSACAIWAAWGECINNPNYMKKSCSPVCQSCDQVTVEGRCPLDPNAKDAWGAGDLDRMFRKLTSEPYLSKHDVQILSSPHEEGGGPWVITMENVVSEEEAERLIELGTIEGYKRSSDVGAKKPDGTYEAIVNSGRTSTNAWCQNDCYNDPVALAVIERLSNLTGIDEPNSEYLQLLRYEKDQFYNSHHDYIPHHVNRRQGVRILTVYLYLNDVPAGGGTKFDRLDLTVMPRRGRALLWPSVRDDDPNAKDPRTHHQALPVEDGVKYGANAWFHLRDFKTPNREGCQ